MWLNKRQLDSHIFSCIQSVEICFFIKVYEDNSASQISVVKEEGYLLAFFRQSFKNDAQMTALYINSLLRDVYHLHDYVNYLEKRNYPGGPNLIM